MASLPTPAPGGAKELKLKMEKMKIETEDFDSRALTYEKELELKKTSLQTSHETQMKLLVRYTDTEEKLRKSEERLKALSQQVNNTETFLKESENFHTFLTQNSCNGNEISDLTERLKCEKERLAAAEKKCRKAGKRKVKLTRQYEAANNHLKDALCKTEALKLKLEYGHIDESRKAAQCGKQLKDTEDIKEKCISMNKSLQSFYKRKSEAQGRIKESKSRINDIRMQLEHTHRHRVVTQMKAKDIRLYGTTHKMY